MASLLLSEPQVQLDRYGKQPTFECIYYMFVDLNVFTIPLLVCCLCCHLVIIVYRYHSWIGLLIPSPLWQLAQYFFFFLYHGSYNTGRKNVFMFDQAWIIWVLYPKYVVSLAIRFTTNVWDATKGNSHNLYCFGNHMGYSNQPSWRKFCRPGAGIFVSLWFT